MKPSQQSEGVIRVSFKDAIITEFKAPRANDYFSGHEEPDFIEVVLSRGHFSTRIVLKGRQSIRVFRVIESAIQQTWEAERKPPESITTKLKKWFPKRTKQLA